MTDPRVKDMTGLRFGALTVKGRAEAKPGNGAKWTCVCDCGRESVVRGRTLRSGVTKSCGAFIHHKKSVRTYPTGPKTDRAGFRSGRLVVIGRGENAPSGGIRWRCQCDCGGEALTTWDNLRRGRAKSCGCLHREQLSARMKGKPSNNRSHGMVDSPEWLAWKNMRFRCEKQKDYSYRNYGGRGIRVCERWQAFENFFADMGQRPSPKHSLDRIDFNGHYEPGNCRWTDMTTQQRNKRSNRLLTIDGVTKCCSEWAAEYGHTRWNLHTRLEYGWPPELAVKTPVGVIPEGLKEFRGQINAERKARAHASAAVYTAVQSGKMTRPPYCQHESACDSTHIEAHHHRGYAKEDWLDVVWLCKSHHVEAEKVLRAEKKSQLACSL